MGGKMGEIEELHFQGLWRVDGVKMFKALTVKTMTNFRFNDGHPEESLPRGKSP